VQSRREPDGVGLGVFELDGTAVVHKRPIAAHQDAEFAREAREVSSSIFLAHVRYATADLRVLRWCSYAGYLAGFPVPTQHTCNDPLQERDPQSKVNP
jgi:hypothetical protein